MGYTVTPCEINRKNELEAKRLGESFTYLPLFSAARSSAES